MSVQTEINRIQGHVDDQADLIAQCLEALEGKVAGGGSSSGGGGGSIDTCTVQIKVDSDAKLYTYVYSYLSSEGEVTARCVDTYLSNTTVVLDNVVCGSFIYIAASGPSLYIFHTNMENLDMYNSDHYYQAPTTANTTGILDCVGDE